MSGNLKLEIQCPVCSEFRLVRTDVLLRIGDKPPICKGCHNRMRFSEIAHPRKGTGVKNDAAMLYTRVSYYKAKRRCKLGVKHHPCYENVEFRFATLQQLVDCIGHRPDGTTLDRIEPLGHYEPGNVRWATKAQQCENRLPRGYWSKVDHDS
jgi:hypothetical protein